MMGKLIARAVRSKIHERYRPPTHQEGRNSQINLQLHDNSEYPKRIFNGHIKVKIFMTNNSYPVKQDQCVKLSPDAKII